MADGGQAALPEGVEQDFPLARLTTVRCGGTADFFARPSSATAVSELLAWAKQRDLAVGVVGSGSNLLVADAGVRALVMKLDGQLTETDFDGTQVTCGGGARLPRLSAQCADRGLSGLEFGVNIPGTVGGAVRMNANAYGGELARILEWVEVATAAGQQQRAASELGFSYRHSNIADGEVVTGARFKLTESTAEQVKLTLAELRDKRKQAQPAGIKTFGSTFKNPEDPRAEGRSAGQLLDAAGCKELAIGGARFSEKHANFIENHAQATTADVIALIVAARKRVHELFGVWLATEVQVLGDVDGALWEPAP